jgi:hypothetical protein
MIKVELRAAKLPSLPGIIADHYWFVVLRDALGSNNKTCDRWEIWQRSKQNDYSWGYLHRNLLPPCQGVGNGPSRLIQDWLGDEALLLASKIESSPYTYPFIQKYRYWPGPNSNTFAQWIVKDQIVLDVRAIGKGFPVPISPDS